MALARLLDETCPQGHPSHRKRRGIDGRLRVCTTYVWARRPRHVGMPAMPACVGLLRDDVNSNAYGVDSSKLARRAAAAGPSVLPLALPVAAPSTAAR